MPPTHDDVLAATVPHDPLARLAAIATTLAPLPATPLDVPSPVDERGAAASSPDSNSNQPEVPEPASASVLDGGSGSPVSPVTLASRRAGSPAPPKFQKIQSELFNLRQNLKFQFQIPQSRCLLPF